MLKFTILGTDWNQIPFIPSQYPRKEILVRILFNPLETMGKFTILDWNQIPFLYWYSISEKIIYEYIHFLLMLHPGKGASRERKYFFYWCSIPGKGQIFFQIHLPWPTGRRVGNIFRNLSRPCKWNFAQWWILAHKQFFFISSPPAPLTDIIED